MIDMSQIKAGDQVRIRYSGIFETPEFQVVLGHTPGQQRVTNSDGRNFYFDSGFIEVIEHKKSFTVGDMILNIDLLHLPDGAIFRSNSERVYMVCGGKRLNGKHALAVGSSTVYNFNYFDFEEKLKILYLPTE